MNMLKINRMKTELKLNIPFKFYKIKILKFSFL